ncbi:DUF1573 domain-containing protein [Rubripirellula amarantea]|uniref:DUF1573 domain-containing protein n=1 Tax=Rubripirellula amarantea TaxID=2527999 RepID=UPI0013EF4973|nr:DUF1573 domain-containing protein [Rubripirellula amarantea]
MKFSEPEYHFGTIQSGEDETRTVELRNPGSTAMRVDRVVGSCNCFEIDQAPIELEANSSCAIELRFSSVIGGPNAYKVRAIANDHTLCETIVRFEGRRELTLIPPRAFVGTLRVGPQTSDVLIPVAFRVRNEHNLPLTAIKLQSLLTDSPLRVTLDDSDFVDSGSFLLNVRGSRETKQRGFHHQPVRLDIAHGDGSKTIEVIIIADLHNE